MKITYVFRASGTGHSIETLFNAIYDEVNRLPSITATIVQLPHISRGLRSVWQNLRFLAKQNVGGLVHITGDVYYAALALPRSRTILTFHDCVLLDKHKGNPVRYALFWLLWYYIPIRRAAVITAISEKTRQELIHYVGKVGRKITVVPNAYAPFFTYQPRRFNQEGPVLLQIGTAPHKNILRLIEAIEHFPCRLIIVGSLSDKMTNRLRARHIAYENYLNLNQTAIMQLYSVCDMVTFVSLYEGFGMPILEANAVGRPVVTSNRSPMTEVGGKAACYVDPTDVSAIREGILKVWHNSEYRAELIRYGLENAQSYTVEKVAAQYEVLYAKLSS